MIHQYKNNGYNIVLDVNSGSVHVVDDLVYDAIALLDGGKTEVETAALLKDKYPAEEIKEALEECRELKDAGVLFTEDIYEKAIFDYKARPTVVKALCLHIAHDCNLACKYCFAEEGEYHGRRALMSFEVGRKALDFLIANSGNRHNLEVDFFGGEPLMNWQVVKAGYQKIIRNPETGFSGAGGEADGNVVAGADECVRDQICFTEVIKDADAGFHFIIIMIDTFFFIGNTVA